MPGVNDSWVTCDRFQIHVHVCLSHTQKDKIVHFCWHIHIKVPIPKFLFLASISGYTVCGICAALHIYKKMCGVHLWEKTSSVRGRPAMLTIGILLLLWKKAVWLAYWLSTPMGSAEKSSLTDGSHRSNMCENFLQNIVRLLNICYKSMKLNQITVPTCMLTCIKDDE